MKIDNVEVRQGMKMKLTKFLAATLIAAMTISPATVFADPGMGDVPTSGYTSIENDIKAIASISQDKPIYVGKSLKKNDFIVKVELLNGEIIELGRAKDTCFEFGTSNLPSDVFNNGVWEKAGQYNNLYGRIEVNGQIIDGKYIDVTVDEAIKVTDTTRKVRVTTYNYEAFGYDSAEGIVQVLAAGRDCRLDPQDGINAEQLIVEGIDPSQITKEGNNLKLSNVTSDVIVRLNSSDSSSDSVIGNEPQQQEGQIDKELIVTDTENPFAYMWQNDGFHYNTVYSHDKTEALVGNQYVMVTKDNNRASSIFYVDGKPHVYVYPVEYLPLGTSEKLAVDMMVQFPSYSSSGHVYFKTPSLPEGHSWNVVINNGAVTLVEVEHAAVKPSDYKKPEQKVEKEDNDDDDDDDEKEESSSSSSSDSSESAPAPLTAEQQAKQTEVAQGTVGSEAYTAKQTEVQNTITTAVASMAAFTPAQKAEVARTGYSVNLGGCTTINSSTVAVMARNNTIPYNMGFTWNGVVFAVKIPAGVDLTTLLDANGNLPMWKLVQKYGLAGARLATG